MNKVLGILLMVIVLYVALIFSDPNAGSLRNHQNIALRIGTAGILVLGVAPLIISGGIDLSIGSVVCLSAVCFALQLEAGIPPGLAIILILLFAPLLGLIHGLLVTQLHLQPFLVTLCGLFVYRGLARWATWTDESGSSRNVGLGGTEWDISSLEFLTGTEPFGVAGALYLFLFIAVVLGVFLHASIYGRYIYAIGANEQATRYAGIPTDRYKILPYMWSSLLAGVYGILYMLEYKTAAPSTAGSFYELYAITGAVLGGCSLRGGEGNIVGIVLGATILPLLESVSFFAGVPDDLKFTVLGVALLLGTIVDEVLKDPQKGARLQRMFGRKSLR